MSKKVRTELSFDPEYSDSIKKNYRSIPTRLQARSNYVPAPIYSPRQEQRVRSRKPETHRIAIPASLWRHGRIKASVNLFALLDGNDPGDKRLVDFDSQPKKKPASAAAPGFKSKKEQASGPAKKKPASAAASTKKMPASAVASGFKSGKNLPALAAGYKAMAGAVATPALPAGPAPAARSPNLTGVLFAYPSARERIFKQIQEEFERRQAKMAENGGGVSNDDGKSANAGAPPADKKNGKTHGVRVQLGGAGYYGARQQPGTTTTATATATATAKEAPARLVSEKQAPSPVVLPTPSPPPSIDDIAQFPSLK